MSEVPEVPIYVTHRAEDMVKALQEEGLIIHEMEDIHIQQCIEILEQHLLDFYDLLH